MAPPGSLILAVVFFLQLKLSEESLKKVWGNDDLGVN